MSELNGVLLVDKPEGITSAGVVRIVKKTLGAQKIGHLGTLDPFASGLLPLCLGTGTKIAQLLLAERKAYTGTIRLGVETDTLDATGTVTRTAPVPPYEQIVLRDLEQRFSGTCRQTPPMYSALKRDGVPLYKLARRGVIVEREPRTVTIEAFTLTLITPDTWDFTLRCSKGTYVRSLAADLGTTLGCGAHLLTLRRTEFGPFTIDEAVPLASLSERPAHEPLPLLSLLEALREYRALSISLATAQALRQGRQSALQDLPPPLGRREETLLLVSSDGDAVALVTWHENKEWQLMRVL